MSGDCGMKGLSAEAGKGIAILAAMLAALLALAYLLFAWHADAQERLQQAVGQHDLVVARAAKAARAGASRLVAADGVEAMFLEGATPGLAIASFQRIAGDAATASGLSVLRMTPADVSEADPSAPYRLTIDAEGSLEQLRNFLVAIETGLPVLFVTRLDIQPAAAEGAMDEFPSEALRISVGVDAYGWRAEP